MAKLTGLNRGVVYAAVRRGDLRARQHKGYKGRKGSIIISIEDYEAWLRDFFCDVV